MLRNRSSKSMLAVVAVLMFAAVCGSSGTAWGTCMELVRGTTDLGGGNTDAWCTCYASCYDYGTGGKPSGGPKWYDSYDSNAALACMVECGHLPIDVASCRSSNVCAPPVASNVNVSGAVSVVETLTGNYTYSDADGIPEGASAFQWYTGTNNTCSGKTAIPGATEKTYTVQAADLGKYLCFGVKAVAGTGKIQQTNYNIGTTTTAVRANTAPVAINANITGTLSVGGTLTGNYTYSDADNDPEGGSTFQWYTSSDSTCSFGKYPIQCATERTYTLTPNEMGTYVCFEVKPAAQRGISPGSPVTAVSSSSVPVISGGSTAGTPSMLSVNPTIDERTSDLAKFNGLLYFTADDVTHGRELWRTDGTAAGTFMVKDIYSAAGHSYPGSYTEYNGLLYFHANDGINGTELWRTDGTASGTVMVKDINPGAGSSDPWYLAVHNGLLYFSANDGTNGSELWRTDGTAAGTVMVKDIYPGATGSGPMYMTLYNGLLYFTAFDGTTGKELWKTDGTATGTVMVKDIRSGAGSSNPRQLSVYNGFLYFGADDGSGYALWKSDGTTAGTNKLYSVVVDDMDCKPIVYNNKLYFYGGMGLWMTDGTTAGTAMVKNFSASPEAIGAFAVSNGVLYMSAYDNATYDIWKTDGTTAGTSKVTNSLEVNIDQPIIEYNGGLYFTADDSNGNRHLYAIPPSTSGLPPGAAMRCVSNMNVANGIAWGAGITERGFYWWNDNASSGLVPAGSGAGNYSLTLTGMLQPQTTYNIVAYIVIGGQRIDSGITRFTTTAAKAPTTHMDTSNFVINGNSITVSAEFADVGNAPVNVYGFVHAYPVKTG